MTHEYYIGTVKLPRIGQGTFVTCNPRLSSCLVTHQIRLYRKDPRLKPSPLSRVHPQTMSLCHLIVAQFAIEGHPRRTEHWSLVALRSKNDAHVFELKGNYDSFTYVPSDVTEFAANPSLRGGCHVGTVGADKVESLKTRLRDVEVIRNNPNFDCQTWVMEALRVMKEDGDIIEDISEARIRGELGMEKDRWESVEDTLETRLFTNE